MLAISVTFTSCSDDDDAPWNDEGTKVELPQRRMFILNEGKADNNNAGIAFYAPNRDANDSIFFSAMICSVTKEKRHSNNTFRSFILLLYSILKR